MLSSGDKSPRASTTLTISATNVYDLSLAFWLNFDGRALQCSSVLAVAEAQNLTQLVAGIELVKVSTPLVAWSLLVLALVVNRCQGAEGAVLQRLHMPSTQTGSSLGSMLLPIATGSTKRDDCAFCTQALHLLVTASRATFR